MHHIVVIITLQTVTFWVDSYCISGLPVLEGAINTIPALSSVFGDDLQISLVFIGNSQYDLLRHIAHKAELLIT